MFAYFATFEERAPGTAPVSAREIETLIGLLKSTPGLKRGLIFTPAQSHDPFADDGPPPLLALELYFAELGALEAALARQGHLQALARPETLPSLAGAAATQQAMVARSFRVPDPRFRMPPGALPCTYLVHYPGAADDLNAWLSYYIDNHPPVMARFPGIREIEICTRIDWCGFLPWERLTLAGVFAVPLLSRYIGLGLHLPLGPLASLAVLAFGVLHARPRTEADRSAAPVTGRLLIARHAAS